MIFLDFLNEYFPCFMPYVSLYLMVNMVNNQRIENKLIRGNVYYKICYQNCSGI